MAREHRLLRKLDRLEKRHFSTEHSHRSGRTNDSGFYAGLLIFTLMISSFLFIIGYHSPELTGFVTFSEPVVSDGVEVQSSGTLSELEPKSVTIDCSADPVSLVNLRLRNSQDSDYLVLLYLEGPLSSSFSWQGSLVHMEKDMPEKTVPLRVYLPDDLPEGEYAHRLTASYSTLGTQDFSGASPFAEAFITVRR